MSTGGKNSGRKEHLRRGLVGVLLPCRFSPYRLARAIA